MSTLDVRLTKQRVYVMMTMETFHYIGEYGDEDGNNIDGDGLDGNVLQPGRLAHQAARALSELPVLGVV